MKFNTNTQHLSEIFATWLFEPITAKCEWCRKIKDIRFIGPFHRQFICDDCLKQEMDKWENKE